MMTTSHRLHLDGYEVVLCASPDERKRWIPMMIGNKSVAWPPAFNLSVPKHIFASFSKQTRMWLPGFLLEKVVTPTFSVLNIKGFRLMDKLWKYYIPPRQIIRDFSR